jgi:2-aminoethylphosphonate-pyruvate transaminase
MWRSSSGQSERGRRAIAGSKNMVLMNPGPVMVDERVRTALMQPDTCHREREFAALMTAIRNKLTALCGGDQRYTTVMFTGSGTAALEALLSSVVSRKQKIVVLDNGHYGERLFKIVSLHGIQADHLSFGWARPFDLDAVERTLMHDPTISHIAMVHHETSTGMLNPLHAVGEIAQRYQRSLAVDGISSIGGEGFDVGGDAIDWCVGTANKCLEGMPGVSFVCAKREKLEALADVRPRTFYLDLYGHYLAEEQAESPPFTPAVQIFYALDQAIDLLLEETVHGRAARYASLARQLRAGLEQLGFQFLLAPEHRSNTLTSIHLPAGITYQALHDELKKEGFVIYAGQEKLYDRVFRVANMGQISSDDIQRFLSMLNAFLARLRREPVAKA